MIRITSSLALGILAASAAFGAQRPEPTTYVSGNLAGVSANSAGTLDYSDEKALSLRAGLTTIPVPYQSISKAELGLVKVHGKDVPLYKVWSLQKRFTGKNKTQNLTVQFKNETGEDQSMTLQLAQSAAPDVLSAIQSHTPPGVVSSAKPTPASKSAANSEWWGDEYWKTTRNVDKWNKTVATTGPQE